MRSMEKELSTLVKDRHPSQARLEKLTVLARKKAIARSFEQGIAKYPLLEPSLIWEAIYVAHVKAKSGVANPNIIETIVGAHQSWLKSSGHAYEEVIKSGGTAALSAHRIRLVLQRDLTKLLKIGGLANETRDLAMLSRLKNGTFDLYALVAPESEKEYCFGCIQCKTSIRERVKGDREPSIQAMSSFFWSVILVLNGDFLRLPEFVEMVNGGSEKFPLNGWHGLYVFSHLKNNDRIYPTNLAFDNFKEHAAQAADMWLHQRQWLNCDWKAQ